MVPFVKLYVFLALFILVPLKANAIADGPDYYAVKDVRSDDTLNIRSGPNHTFEKIGEIPYNGRGIANLGCFGGASPAQWYDMNEKEREISRKSRWCKIRYDGIEGFVAGWYLKEDVIDHSGYDTFHTPSDSLASNGLPPPKQASPELSKVEQDFENDLIQSTESYEVLKGIYDIGSEYNESQFIYDEEMATIDDFYGFIKSKILNRYPEFEIEKISQDAKRKANAVKEDYRRAILTHDDELDFAWTYKSYIQHSRILEKIHSQYQAH